MLARGKAGRLYVEIFEDRRALGEKAAADAARAIAACIKAKGWCSVIFAAAPSQNEFLEALSRCGIESDGIVDFSKVHAYHMDEYAGLPADAPQSFGSFLKRSIFDKVPFGRVEYLNGCAEDLEEEARRYGQLLREDPPDLVFMGIGENGHIAFNDPHVARFDDPVSVKVVSLDEICRMQQVHDGCFDSLEKVPEQALTLTVPTLFAAKRLFCMVPAATKAEAVQKTVMGEIREQVPASVMRMHHQAALYLDPDSGKKLLEAGFGKE